MPDLLELSASVIDEARTDVLTNRVTNELSELADGIAFVESFSHSVVFDTPEGLVVFDASGIATGGAVVESIRGWRTAPVHTLVYTHGHVDHVGGSGAFLADAASRSNPNPAVVGHEAVAARFNRYRLTDGYNLAINNRQFGWLRDSATLGTGLGIGGDHRFLPRDAAEVTVAYRDVLELTVGGLDLELHHGRGETDDHTWTWIPEHKAICSGDFLIWNFPNAGNPQKVQRYPAEWAQAMRAMAAKEPELLLPAHGLPIAGKERVATVLLDVAGALEALVADTLDLMNAGATLDEVVHSVKVPDDTLAKPYLRPFYDEPEFVVRNIWRLYGGWYDGNPARLKPPTDAAVGAAVAKLAGSPAAVVGAAREAADANDLRLACTLVEMAADAAPDDAEVQAARAEIYQRRKDGESSLMAKGIFSTAARESKRRAEQLGAG
jgi:alkyl sulfatase BDS1-like metallo-beta-lactamase superfamily hydrolase